MSESSDISAIEQLHPDEWLLIEVEETDAADLPVKGKLLCHSKSRDEIHEVIMKVRTPERDLYIAYPGDPVPPGVAVVL
jgi:hypothetical protein